MKVRATRTQFVFDFTHAGEVTWTHGRQRATLEAGKAAAFSIDDQQIARGFRPRSNPSSPTLSTSP